MSDLLDRLIGRAAGAPSRVEPVLPSRYETWGAQDWPAPLDQAGLSEADPVVRWEVDGLRDTKTPVTRESVQPSRSVRVGDEPAQRMGVPPAPEVSELSGRRPAAEALIVPPTPANPVSQRQDGAQPPRRSPATVVKEAGPGVSEPAGRLERAEVRAANLPSRPAASVGVNVEREESRPPSMSHRPAEASIARMDGLAPVEVRVTIGHIEVRAAPAAAATPQRRTSRPTVSLADYLRRRNGGAQ